MENASLPSFAPKKTLAEENCSGHPAKTMEAVSDLAPHGYRNAISVQFDGEMRLVIDTIPVLAWCHGNDGSSEFFNERWHNYTGLSVQDATGWGWTVTVHPEDLPRLLQVWEKLRAAKRAGGLEARLRRFDGEYRWFLFQAEPVLDSFGELSKWYGASTDIHDRKWAQALLAGENQILEMISRGSSVNEILDGSCRFVDEFLGDSIAVILLISEDGKHLRWGAGPRLPAPVAAVINGFKILPGVGSCSAAAYGKKQVIINDILTDPQWEGLRDFATVHGLRASWSTPVMAFDGSTLATFAIYWRKPCSPTAEHQQIIRSITHLIAVAIERKRAADALSASEKFARDRADVLMHSLDAMARESSPERIVEHVLLTLSRQLDTHSSVVWLTDKATGLLELAYAMEEGSLKAKASTAKHLLRLDEPSLRLSELRDRRPIFIENFQTDIGPSWRKEAVAQEATAVLFIPMRVSGDVAGIIGVCFCQKRTMRSEEIDLAQALTNQATLALQMISLSAQSRQVAVIDERNRMARDIHDTLAQGFTGVIVQLEAAQEAITHEQNAQVRQHLDRAGKIARESLREARYSVRALRPEVLEERSLSLALKDLGEKMTMGTSLRSTFAATGEHRKLAPEWETNLLRIGQEALTNALRHAQAKEFRMEIAYQTKSIRLSLHDDGRGFDFAEKHEGLGLRGIRERTDLMGGVLTVRSRKTKGTEISITLPLPTSADC